MSKDGRVFVFPKCVVFHPAPNGRRLRGRSEAEAQCVEQPVETGMEINRTTTDGSGYYQFCDLSPGVYRIYEEIKEGWTQLSPVGWLPPLAPVYPATTKGGYHEVPLYCDN